MPPPEHVAQVGGDHYEAVDGVQHWDLIEKHDVAYLEGNASKYVTRWRTKYAGAPRKQAEDLLKAASYLDRILQEGRGTRRLVPMVDLRVFIEGNDLCAEDAYLVCLILSYGSVVDLETAATKLRSMAAVVEQQEPTP